MPSDDKNKTANFQIGRRIQFVRCQQNLTVKELAMLSSMPANQLQAFENDGDMITAVDLSLLARSLDLPVEFFVHESSLLDWSGEWQLLHVYRRLQSESRERVMHLLLDLAADLPISLRS